MIAYDNLLLFLGASLALAITPGPDMLFILARSASYGCRAGVVSTLGIATGLLVHIAAAALGLSGLLIAVPAAYDAVRFAGAAYLVYLGARALLSRSSGEPGGPALERVEIGLRKIYTQGLITNVLNPKVALFFLAFLPQFVDPGNGSVPAQFVLLGVLFSTTGTLVNLGVALATSRAAAWTRGRARGAVWLERMSGLIFVGLGLRLALQRQA